MDENTNITVTFRHTEPTEALKNHATEKIAHFLKKYDIKESIDATVTLTVEKRDHTADVRITALGFELSASETTEDLYSAIDKVIAPLEAQVRKQKGKRG